MTRQHFEAIAATIKASVDEENRLKRAERVTIAEHVAAMEAIRELSRNLCDVFDRFNPQFNTDKFMAACGLE